MKKDFKLFCFGFGQVAKYFVENLIKKNFTFELIATNTKETQLKEFKDIKYKSYYFLDNKFDKNLLEDFRSSNKILISVPPKKKQDIVLETFNTNFQNNKFDWVSYLSATSVYGDKKGKWVNEESSTEPTSEKGIDRLNAENHWLKYYKDFNLPLQIFRLSGIYSPENNILKRLKMGNLRVVEKNNHFFSRIHVEDIAEILTLSLNKIYPGQIFNVSDDYPASNIEIAKYAAELVKMDIPKKIKPNEIENEILKNFYRDSKKVSNQKMKNFFEYNLKYPTFREGLAIIKNNFI